MSIIEVGKQFEKDLNDLKVSELCEKGVQDMLIEVRQKIDEFLSMLSDSNPYVKRKRRQQGDMIL